MIITLTENKDQIKKVLCNPEIYDTISGDHALPIEEYEPQPATYLAGFIEDEIIGVFVFHPKNIVLWQCHIQVLPEHRKKYAREFAQEGLKWFWENSEALRLSAEIPSLYPNVLNFAMNNGFKIDGRIDMAYLKNSQLHSVYYLSMGRPYELGR